MFIGAFRTQFTPSAQMRAFLCIHLCPFEQTTVFLLPTLQALQGLAAQSKMPSPGMEELLKHAHKEASLLRDFSSGAALGGEVSRYRQKQNIYAQGEPAETLSIFKKEGCASRLEGTSGHRLLLQSWESVISLANFASQATPCVCARLSR
jgi:hypothetical protein